MAVFNSPRSKLSPQLEKVHYLEYLEKGPYYLLIYLFQDNGAFYLTSQDNGKKDHGCLRHDPLITVRPSRRASHSRGRCDNPKKTLVESILTKRGQSLHHQRLVDIQKVSKHNISHPLFFRKLDSMLTKADQAQGHASGYKATVLWTTPDSTNLVSAPDLRETIKRRGAAAWANY